MDILTAHYPDEDHVLMFDNATTHLKCADNALSARHMPKFPTKPDKPHFGVTVNELDKNGKLLYG
jgi:hypothetical protein